MWLMTQHGLFSVIEDEDPAYLLIRARRKQDLENLASCESSDEACDLQPILQGGKKFGPLRLTLKSVESILRGESDRIKLIKSRDLIRDENGNPSCRQSTF